MSAHRLCPSAARAGGIAFLLALVAGNVRADDAADDGHAAHRWRHRQVSRLGAACHRRRLVDQGAAAEAGCVRVQIQPAYGSDVAPPSMCCMRLAALLTRGVASFDAEEKLDTNGAKLDANGAKLDANGAKLDANGAKLDANGMTLREIVQAEVATRTARRPLPATHPHHQCTVRDGTVRDPRDWIATR